jgi:phosphoglycolate phosphatase-like HAD superfamily hydrolase
MKPRIILFDFDGVIVNTFDFCYQINTICNPDLTPDQYRERFHGNINECIPKEQKEAKRKDGFDFFALYTPELMKKSLEQKVRDLIKTLSETYTLYIVSSTNTDAITAFLKENGLLPCFTAIYGNDVETSKVKKFQKILKTEKAEPSDCVLITDTLGDIREAETCSIPVIAVSWGYHRRETLAQGKPMAIVDTVEELAQRISSL